MKADLHLHSRYSEHPTEWFLKRLGASESYTEPDYIYKMAKDHGMDLVTITDHNRIDGCLILKEKYPNEVFVGLESTAHFPEDGCKVHILVYGLNETQFQEIQQIRKNIYDMRDYLVEKRLPYSVAHATYSVNDKITVPHLEKLILLFNTFERINGGRNRLNNTTWSKVLASLTPEIIEDLRKKHGIEPYSDDPWVKGYTGGSDDHAGMFIGKTYTYSNSYSADSFLDCIRNKQSEADGRHNDFHFLAFHMYKIAYDFSRSKNKGETNSFFKDLTEFVFVKKSLNLLDHFNVTKYSAFANKSDKIQMKLVELVRELREGIGKDIENKLGLVYDKLAQISDEFFKITFNTLEKDIRHGDIVNLVRNISSSIPGIFLSIPFFTSLKHMYDGKKLLTQIADAFQVHDFKKNKRILWFTDTLIDLNGVAEVLRKIGWLAHQNQYQIHLVTSLSEEEITDDVPPNVINVPFIYRFDLPGYEHFNLKVPSFLQSIKMLSQFEPDEIFISSPGPIGLLGIILSRLLSTKSVGVFHTDFSLQSQDIVGDHSVVSLLESYVHWFFSVTDEIKVPTNEYMNILQQRDYDRSKMTLFKRGIDSNVFCPSDLDSDLLREEFHMKPGFVLLYTGRVSQDKNIDFLLDVYKAIFEKRKDVYLIIAGNGPYYDEFVKKAKPYKQVMFTGRRKRTNLVRLYSGSDLFLFPSKTDTFGMVILEAQACGLPAIVSDVGGPKELVVDQKTGYILSTNHKDLWVQTIESMIHLKQTDATGYKDLRSKTRQHILEFYNWNQVLDEITGKSSHP